MPGSVLSQAWKEGFVEFSEFVEFVEKEFRVQDLACSSFAGEEDKLKLEL